ncbi:hypothetical protein, partial [Candidatus Cyanaurora vandensis]|uniref:hypothetical protein n=1 Tax=Candidatus Cyanaurora vandensis TaxID=2714958 RepID=UPI00257C627E
SQSLLARLSGSNRPAIKKFLQVHQAQFEAYNLTQGLGPHHNLARAKRKNAPSPEQDILGLKDNSPSLQQQATA